MEDEKRQEVRAWLRRADNDLRSAQVDLKAEAPVDRRRIIPLPTGGGEGQKGFLTAHDTTFRKTHDLDELASACEQIDASLKDSLNPARDLTVFAWEFRYPGSDEAPPETEAHDSVLLAKAVVDGIRQRLHTLI